MSTESNEIIFSTIPAIVGLDGLYYEAVGKAKWERKWGQGGDLFGVS